MDRKKDNLALEAALDQILDNIRPVTQTEEVPLLEAVGRILAGDMTAHINNPPFDRSPVDGYAVRSRDLSGACREMPIRLSVVAQIDAGMHYEGTVLPGQAVRIMTGAPVPAGCDACIRQESTDYGETVVEIYEECAPFTNYCYAGEDFQAGQQMLKDGSRLGYVEIGVLASMGCGQVPVYKKPRVALFTTGDELIFPGKPLRPGKLYNSNLFGLAARMQELGIRPFIFAHLPDDPELAAKRIREAAGECSLILTTGGVSVGKKDIIHDVIVLLGARRIFWGIAIKPGMPTVFSMLDDVPMISLTGNPFGALTNFELIVRPALARLCRDNFLLPVWSHGLMTGCFEKPSPVRRFVRAIYHRGVVTLPEGSHSSGVLASMQGCNCLVDIPAGSKAILPGKRVRVLFTGASPDENVTETNIPPLFGVCGVKNSGKTTLIERLLSVFSGWGMKVAVIKHDGHDFEADVPGTDSYRFFAAGADAAAVYSDSKWAVVSRQTVSAPELAQLFPWADMILCEGLKHWEIPKLEIVRKENSSSPVCTPQQVSFYVSDMKSFGAESESSIPDQTAEIYPLDAIEEIASAIVRHCHIEIE